MRRQIEVMGVSFVDQPFHAAVEQLSDALRESVSRTVFFANAATLNIACADPAYRDTLNSASFMFGDGTGVRWAARARGLNLQANLNGTDLVPELIAANPGIRVYLLGGHQEMIERAARKFSLLFPRADLVGWRNGYFDHGDCGQVVHGINAATPHLLLVGFGNPLQERWIAANRTRLRVPLTAGVGGLFSYWAGTLQRAPRIYRQLGMEWVHILISQPHKMGRYLLGNPLFIMRMLAGAPDGIVVRPVNSLVRRPSSLTLLQGFGRWPEVLVTIPFYV